MPSASNHVYRETWQMLLKSPRKTVRIFRVKLHQLSLFTYFACNDSSIKIFTHRLLLTCKTFTPCARSLQYITLIGTATHVGAQQGKRSPFANLKLSDLPKWFCICDIGGIINLCFVKFIVLLCLGDIGLLKFRKRVSMGALAEEKEPGEPVGDHRRGGLAALCNSKQRFNVTLSYCMIC